MEKTERARRAKFGFAVVFVLPVVLYLGGYLILVRRIDVGPVGGYLQQQARYASNMVVDAFLAGIFAPLHSADRKVRQDYWADKKFEYQGF